MWTDVDGVAGSTEATLGIVRPILCTSHTEAGEAIEALEAMGT